MSQFEPAPPTLATTRAPADRLTRLLRPRLLRMLDKLEGGSLTVLEGRERHVLGKGGARNVTLRIHDSRAWRRMALAMAAATCVPHCKFARAVRAPLPPRTAPAPPGTG